MIIIYIALIILAVAMLAQAFVIWKLKNQVDDLENFKGFATFLFTKIGLITIKEKQQEQNNNKESKK